MQGSPLPRTLQYRSCRFTRLETQPNLPGHSLSAAAWHPLARTCQGESCCLRKRTGLHHARWDTSEDHETKQPPIRTPGRAWRRMALHQYSLPARETSCCAGPSASGFHANYRAKISPSTTACFLRCTSGPRGLGEGISLIQVLRRRPRLHDAVGFRSVNGACGVPAGEGLPRVRGPSTARPSLEIELGRA